MFKIICKKLMGERCDFVTEGAIREEVKSNFYTHGAESPLHKEAYESAFEKGAAECEKDIDAYLDQ